MARRMRSGGQGARWLLLSLCVLLLLSGCGQKKAAFSARDFVMDTLLTQQLYGADQESAEAAARAVVAALKEQENRLSAFSDKSEIGQINRAQGEPVVVSRETFALIQRALTYSLESAGCFDVTVYPLSRLWKQTLSDGVLPSEAAVKKAREQVNFRAVRLDESKKTVTLPAGAGLDLGAVAKGAALESARACYKEAGVNGAVCSLGGSAMLVMGQKPDGSAFRIGLRNPFSQDSTDFFAVLPVRDRVLSTSGTYERCREIDGYLVHHILDPSTGKPAESDLASVTVLGQDGAACDFLSTRLFLAGFSRAKELVKQQGLSAVLVSQDRRVFVTEDLVSDFSLVDKTFERIEG